MCCSLPSIKKLNFYDDTNNIKIIILFTMGIDYAICSSENPGEELVGEDFLKSNTPSNWL